MSDPYFEGSDFAFESVFDIVNFPLVDDGVNDTAESLNHILEVWGQTGNVVLDAFTRNGRSESAASGFNITNQSQTVFLVRVLRILFVNTMALFIFKRQDYFSIRDKLFPELPQIVSRYRHDCM